MKRSPTRRQVLQSTAFTGLAAFAGCLSTGSSEQGIGRSGEETTTTGSPTRTPLESLDDWLADANGYDGEINRYGPRSQPDISVGEPVDGEMAFVPPVIEVAPMSNVHWEWTGHGGRHNVVALDGTFDSGRTNAQSGISYQYIFDEPGEYPFVSEPRYEEGMKGAVIVKEPPSTGNRTVDEWVVDSGNFDGSVADRTGVSTATITVGAEAARGNFVFEPPVLRVSVGTTIEWEWSGRGGPHNVVFEDGDIRSDEIYADPGVHLEHTFEESGTYRYACEPHQSLGMKGAVIVE